MIRVDILHMRYIWIYIAKNNKHNKTSYYGQKGNPVEIMSILSLISVISVMGHYTMEILAKITSGPLKTLSHLYYPLQI